MNIMLSDIFPVNGYLLSDQQVRHSSNLHVMCGMLLSVTQLFMRVMRCDSEKCRINWMGRAEVEALPVHCQKNIGSH